MRQLKLNIIIFGFFIQYSFATENIRLSSKNNEDTLYLTPLIEAGKIDEARKSALFQFNNLTTLESYAGYLTVNKTYNSNLFFWYFPSQINRSDAPVLLWLNGGPGASSLYGFFLENGPYFVTDNEVLKSRDFSWNKNHNIIYVDNPVGVGFSFTDNDLGYARNSFDAGRNLLTALVQFFKLFPELQKNEFYVTGESYGGKYVPVVAHAIKTYNDKSSIKINLKGMAIGNGWTDPINQMNFSNFLYELGLVDFDGREQLRNIENKIVNLIKEKNYYEAFMRWDSIFFSRYLPSPITLKSLTGFSYPYNFLHSKSPNYGQGYVKWLQRSDVMKALHVRSNITFVQINQKINDYFIEEIMQSVDYLIADLLQHYKIMFFSGHLDLIVPYTTTENFLRVLNWAGAENYNKAVRKQWWVDNELAGYSKTAGPLTVVLVRNAGHLVPADQPKWAWDLITKFTHNETF